MTVSWYFSLLVILLQNRQNIFSLIFKVQVPFYSYLTSFFDIFR